MSGGRLVYHAPTMTEPRQGEFQVPAKFGDPARWREMAPPGLQAARRELIRNLAAGCPHCGMTAMPGDKPDTRIYHLSRTAVTMKCPNCQLQWSMTFHMIARMARHVGTRGGTEWGPGMYDAAHKLFDVPETRRPMRVPSSYTVYRPQEPPEGGSVG